MTAHKEPRLVVAPKSVARFKAKLKTVLRRARGVRRDNQDETGATIRMRLAPGMG